MPMPNPPYTAPCPNWKDMSDAEVRTRLIHHGCDVQESKVLTVGRHSLTFAKQINDWLTNVPETAGAVEVESHEMQSRIKALEAELAAARDEAKVKL